MGQRWEAIFWPIPSEDYTLYYQYRRLVAQMTSATEYPYGGALHSYTILQFARVVSEESKGLVNGPLAKRLYQTRERDGIAGILQTSIERDQALARNIGYNADRSDDGGQRTTSIGECQFTDD